jgi:hypothetical protein
MEIAEMRFVRVVTTEGTCNEDVRDEMEVAHVITVIMGI